MIEIPEEKRIALYAALFHTLCEFPQFQRLPLDEESAVVEDYIEQLIIDMQQTLG